MFSTSNSSKMVQVQDILTTTVCVGPQGNVQFFSPWPHAQRCTSGFFIPFHFIFKHQLTTANHIDDLVCDRRCLQETYAVQSVQLWARAYGYSSLSVIILSYGLHIAWFHSIRFACDNCALQIGFMLCYVTLVQCGCHHLCVVLSLS